MENKFYQGFILVAKIRFLKPKNHCKIEIFCWIFRLSKRYITLP